MTFLEDGETSDAEDGAFAFGLGWSPSFIFWFER